MLIRNFVPGDAEHWADIVAIACVDLPGYRSLTAEEVKRKWSGHRFDPSTTFFAEDENQVVGHASFDPQSGRVSFPWCKPGYERLSHPLFAAVMRGMAQRKLTRAFAAYPSEWSAVWEFFEDHDFVKARDVINYTQSIGDLPTMFQRPGMNVTPLRAADLPEIQQMGGSVLRLDGERLADYWLKNPRLGTDAIFVLRRKDGGVKGVGLMIDDAQLKPVEDTNPNAADFRLGSFGSEGYVTEGINGLFSFLAPPGKDAEINGQDLLWYATSRAATNSFENLAGQAPSDAPHLKAFFDRYFRKAGCFPVYEREIGTESKF